MFTCGGKSGEAASAPRPQQSSGGYAPMPEDGWHLCLITDFARCVTNQNTGKTSHRLTFTVQMHDYRPVTVVITCDKNGQPVGKFGYPRLNAIAKAVGIQDGKSFDFPELMNTPLRVKFATVDRFCNPTEFERATQQDRDDLSSYLANLGEAGGM